MNLPGRRTYNLLSDAMTGAPNRIIPMPIATTASPIRRVVSFAAQTTKTMATDTIRLQCFGHQRMLRDVLALLMYPMPTGTEVRHGDFAHIALPSRKLHNGATSSRRPNCHHYVEARYQSDTNPAENSPQCREGLASLTEADINTTARRPCCWHRHSLVAC